MADAGLGRSSGGFWKEVINAECRKQEAERKRQCLQGVNNFNIINYGKN